MTRRWIYFFVGITILTFGSRLLLLSEVGVGGVDAIAIGLAEKLRVEIGTMLIALSAILIMIGNVLEHKFVWTPFITALIIGKCYDLWGVILFDHLNVPITEGGKGAIYLLGLLIAPAGATIYILSNISTGPIDYLMLALTKRYTAPIKNTRIMLETLFVVSGYLVGGPIGVGTAGIMLFWGPILEIYYNLGKKWLR